MSMDPFGTLGVSPNASEDEIKSAYRKLAKKYHPDVNNGSAEAETKMKEINEAYSQAIKIKRGGGTYNASQSQQSSQYGRGYAQQDYDEGFGGFGGFGFGGFNGYGYSEQSSSPELRAARNYINTGHYQEAINLLQRMTERSAEWFYLSARANIGVGNRAAALTYAKQAVQLEPNNYEYSALLSRLEGNSESYRRNSAPFGGIPLNYCSSPCAWICLLNIFCSCCRGCGSCGYTRF